MSKIESIQDFVIGEFGVQAFNDVGKTGFGDRDHLFEIGKPINDVIWHTKPKQFRSGRKQIELYFGWMVENTDYRTRRVILANLYQYFKTISELDFDNLTDLQKDTCQRVDIPTLTFNPWDIPRDHPLLDQALFSMNPVDDYVYFMEEGTDEQKTFAEIYGTFGIEKTYSQKKLGMNHRFYTYKRAVKYGAREFKGRKNGYICTSVVYVNKARNEYIRNQHRVTEFSLLFAELDYYKNSIYTGKSKQEMIKLIHQELDEHGFPYPTEIIFSRGLQLMWKISPIPEHRRLEWEILQKKIHEMLEKFEPDFRTTTDKVRLLRLVGTTHEKTGKRIFGYTYTDDRLLFDDLLHTYCSDELDAFEAERKKRLDKARKSVEKKKRDLKVIPGKKNVKTPLQEDNSSVHYVGNRAFHEKYLADVKNLVVLRNGKLSGYREFICFLVRYWTLCITGSDLKAIREMEKVFGMMDIESKYTFNEIIAYTSSAVKAHDKWKKNVYQGYNYKSTTLVKKLDVTPDEERTMMKIMSEEEAARRSKKRDVVKKRTKRKAQGLVSHDELHQAILQVTEENPDMKSYKVAELVREKVGKCSKNTVEKVWKENR